MPLVFLCALPAPLAKPMAVTLPFALLWLAVGRLGRIRSPGPQWRRLFWEKVRIVLLAVGAAWIALAGQNASGALKSAVPQGPPGLQIRRATCEVVIHHRCYLVTLLGRGLVRGADVRIPRVSFAAGASEFREPCLGAGRDQR